jgi:hypothetical protein
MDMKWVLFRMPYGDRWRRGRKLLHAHIHQGVAVRYHPVQIASARRFARDILSVKTEKEALANVVRASFGQSIIKMVYGIDAQDADSEYISLPEQVIRYTSQGATPGRFLVDSLPFCECQMRSRING